jgi:hypothetical protein
VSFVAESLYHLLTTHETEYELLDRDCCTRQSLTSTEHVFEATFAGSILDLVLALLKKAPEPVPG